MVSMLPEDGVGVATDDASARRREDFREEVGEAVCWEENIRGTGE